MASRKVLQEIPVLPPKTEEQSFKVVTEEAIAESYNKLLSLPARAHAKYISNDESKENITPTEFDTEDKYKCVVGKPEDLTGPKGLGDQERTESGSCISLQPKDEVTLGYAAGAESIFTPIRHSECSDWRIGESNTPMDFSKVTVDDFGISRESFTNCVGKSPKSLHKHRRRSTIGVRGSPEMNFLIRQIALQRSNRKMDPEPQSSPFISPRNSMLKEKMSSFRNAFQAVEETEGKLPFPGFSEEDKTQGSKVYGNTCEKTEPLEKRKRVSDASLPEIQSVPVKPQAQRQKTTQDVVKVPVLEEISESEAAKDNLEASKSVNLQKEEFQPVPSSTRGQKRKVVFAEISSSPASKRRHNETHKSDSCKSSSSVLRPALKKTSATKFSLRDEPGDQRVCFLLPESSEKENKTLFKKTVNDSVKKKKRVTFGKKLSPELFDKTLPPNTPLRKGSTPCHPHESDTTKPTVQVMVHQSPCQSMPQPDFDCRDEEDVFKPLSLCFDAASPSRDSSPGDDQVWPNKDLKDVILENLPEEECETLLISNEFPENITSSPALDTEIANETFIASEPGTVPINRRATRFSNKSKACSSGDPSTSDHIQTADASKIQVNATAKPSFKRGRKPVIVKVQVKIPWGKVKKSRGRPKKSKSVQEPVYRERETVSKKPPLSPIPELPEYYPTPPASLVSAGGTFNKRLGKRMAKRKAIRRDIENIQKKKVPSEVVEFFSDPVMKIEDVMEGSCCAGKEGLEVQLIDSERHPEPVDLPVKVDTLSTSTEFHLSLDDQAMKQDQEWIPEPSESVAEYDGTEETMTAVKPQNKSKRRSTTRRSASQTTTEVQHLITETPKDLVVNFIKAEHLATETVTEDPQPEKDLLVKDRAQSPELVVTVGVANGRRGRRSKNYHIPAFCPSTEPNIHSQDPCTTLHHPSENPSIFPDEPCLPIDEIFQSVGTEKKVRRSLRLRRESGGSGLSWVQESTGRERTKRRKSLSSAGQSMEGSNLTLESITSCPNEEQLSVQQEASADKKTRRRTLCISTLQQATSVYDQKRRRSNVSYKNSSVETQTYHNSTICT